MKLIETLDHDLTIDLYEQAKSFFNPDGSVDISELRKYTKMLYKTEELNPTLIIFACGTVFEHFADKYFETNDIDE